MAKGDVVLKFDAQTAEFVNRILAARSALEATADTARKAGDAVAKAGDGVEKFAAKIASGAASLAGMIGIPVTIMGGLTAVLKEAELRVERLEKRAEGVAQRSATFDSAMFSLGAQNRTEEIKSQLSAMASMTYSGRQIAPATFEKMFAQVAAGAGASATPDRVILGLHAGVQGLHGGASEEQVVQLATQSTRLMAAIPDLDWMQAADLAHEAQSLAPGMLDDEQSLHWIARAKDKQRMVRRLAAGRRSSVGSRAYRAIATEALDRGMDFEYALEHPNMLKRSLRPEVDALNAEEARLPATSAVTDAPPGDAARVIDITKSNVEQRRIKRITEAPNWDVLMQEKRELAVDMFKQQYGPSFLGMSESLMRHGFGEPGHPGLYNEEQMQAAALAEVVQLLRQQNVHSGNIDEHLREMRGNNPMLINGKEGQKAPGDK